MSLGLVVLEEKMFTRTRMRKRMRTRTPTPQSDDIKKRKNEIGLNNIL